MEKELTFGESVVGINFNPSKNKDVDAIKKLFAEVITYLHSIQENQICSPNKRSFLDVAITNTITAQMWAVKGAVEDIYIPISGVPNRADAQAELGGVQMNPNTPYQPKLPLEN